MVSSYDYGVAFFSQVVDSCENNLSYRNEIHTPNPLFITGITVSFQHSYDFQPLGCLNYCIRLVLTVEDGSAHLNIQKSCI